LLLQNILEVLEHSYGPVTPVVYVWDATDNKGVRCSFTWQMAKPTITRSLPRFLSIYRPPPARRQAYSSTD
jgi:hypothetical protein